MEIHFERDGRTLLRDQEEAQVLIGEAELINIRGR